MDASRIKVENAVDTHAYIILSRRGWFGSCSVGGHPTSAAGCLNKGVQQQLMSFFESSVAPKGIMKKGSIRTKRSRKRGRKKTKVK
jgi:hypothetical protein